VARFRTGLRRKVRRDRLDLETAANSSEGSVFDSSLSGGLENGLAGGFVSVDFGSVFGDSAVLGSVFGFVFSGSVFGDLSFGVSFSDSNLEDFEISGYRLSEALDFGVVLAAVVLLTTVFSLFSAGWVFHFHGVSQHQCL